MISTDIVRQFYANLAKGDVTAVLGLLADELYWTEAARFPYYSGTWTTRQQIVDNLFVPLGRDWDGFQVRADRFISEGDTVVALGEYTGLSKRSGKRLAAPLAHVWTISGDRIVGFYQYTDTALVLEALGA